MRLSSFTWVGLSARMRRSSLRMSAVSSAWGLSSSHGKEVSELSGSSPSSSCGATLSTTHSRRRFSTRGSICPRSMRPYTSEAMPMRSATSS
jgi:hypothetical protein